MIKILIVADTYEPKVDGTLKFMQEFIKRADKFEISLLVPDLGLKKKPSGVKDIKFVTPSKKFTISGYPSMKYSHHNRQLIRNSVQQADLVFVQGPGLISYLSVWYAHRYDKKVVFYLHTIAWELFAKFMPRILNKLFFRIIKRLSILSYNKCDALLVPYHDLQDYLIKEGVKTKIHIAKLGVDIDLFSPVRDLTAQKSKLKLPNKPIIGYVGRISKEKNTHILLEAVKKLDNVHLLMVGDGPKNQVADFKKLPNCTVTGFVNNVQDYLKAMDIFVMPSLTETTSLATLEAMSCGLPVIATKIGFMQNYIVKNHNGVFFPKNSSAVLAIKIRKIMEDEVFKNELKVNARRTIAYSFSWERSIGRIKKLLIQLV